jgi:hypothetical protein
MFTPASFPVVELQPICELVYRVVTRSVHSGLALPFVPGNDQVVVFACQDDVVHSLDTLLCMGSQSFGRVLLLETMRLSRRYRCCPYVVNRLGSGRTAGPGRVIGALALSATHA